MHTKRCGTEKRRDKKLTKGKTKKRVPGAARSTGGRDCYLLSGLGL